MSKLEELRQLVANMFESATDKEQINMAAKINSSIDDVAKEQQELIDKNAELIEDYRSLVKHTSFSGSIPASEDIGNQGETFDLDAAVKTAFKDLK